MGHAMTNRAIGKLSNARVRVFVLCFSGISHYNVKLM